MGRIFFIIMIFCFNLFTSRNDAQVNPEKIKQFLSQPSLTQYNLQQLKAVKDFYRQAGYNGYWLSGRENKNVQQLSKYISEAVSLGLKPEDYQPELLKARGAGLLSLVNDKDSVIAEIKFTDAALHFFHDVLMGNKPVTLSYNGLNYQPACFDVAQLLLAYLNSNSFENMLRDIEPKEPAYQSVKKLLNVFQQRMATDNFKDIAVNPSKNNNANKILKQRLYQLGFTESDTVTMTDAVFKQKIKEAQKLFGLLNDGILRSATVAAMNVPLPYRAEELKNTLNTIRWLSCIKQTENIILVNIPAATLLLYEKGHVVLESRTVVGKKSTTTPTLSSKVTEVILYPYWNVPYKIATTELLPVIKRNRGYLDANNFQVLNSAGKVVNPAAVNWHALSPGYFPYTIRQSTGCDNSLGLIKLNFYNPYSVYLHDTPYKSMFMFNRRYFSHGCMRLEKAMEVAHYILGDNTIAIDTLEDKGCLRNQQPVIVPASHQLPVFVLYHTAWFDSSARVVFYEDVYNKFANHK